MDKYLNCFMILVQVDGEKSVVCQGPVVCQGALVYCIGQK